MRHCIINGYMKGGGHGTWCINAVHGFSYCCLLTFLPLHNDYCITDPLHYRMDSLHCLLHLFWRFAPSPQASPHHHLNPSMQDKFRFSFPGLTTPKITRKEGQAPRPGPACPDTHMTPNPIPGSHAKHHTKSPLPLRRTPLAPFAPSGSCSLSDILYLLVGSSMARDCCRDKA